MRGAQIAKPFVRVLDDVSSAGRSNEKIEVFVHSRWLKDYDRTSGRVLFSDCHPQSSRAIQIENTCQWQIGAHICEVRIVVPVWASPTAASRAGKREAMRRFILGTLPVELMLKNHRRATGRGAL